MFTVLSVSQGSPAGLSAKRLPHQDVTEFLDTALLPLSQQGSRPSLSEEQITKWNSYQELEAFFKESRDLRYIEDSKSFLRRISWLYPDDGCFTRAALVNQLAQKKQMPEPSRVFLYGNLEAYTPNAPGYSVTWWYHTAPIVNVEGNLYVMDASLDPLKPMKLEDWVNRQIKSQEPRELVFCEAQTYDPRSSCLAPQEDSGEKALRDIQFFLRREWSRQLELERDPHQVLGDSPPWLESHQRSRRHY